MADSDNSRTLPPVTQRGLLSGTAVWLNAQAAWAAADTVILSLWEDWLVAHKRGERLCRAQQRLERCLVSAVGFPRADVLRPGAERTVAAFTTSQIDALLGEGIETADERKDAKSVLLARQKAWNAMDNRLGYSCARLAEEEAEAESEQLALALWAEPARSIAGIVAKLHAVLITCESNGNGDEPPWPQIRSILVDLINLDDTTTTLAS